MKKIPLSLNTADTAQPAPEQKPVSGWLAVGFGVLGVFGPGILFAPLALICSIFALLRGQAAWGVFGLILAVFGLMTSVQFWLLIGMGWILTSADWEWLKTVIETIKFGGGGIDI